jgi:3-isopropylmalate/(R)-2-methylmalate dehydratase small subunit
MYAGFNAMHPFTTLTGIAAPLMLSNVDTDVIIRINRLTAGDLGSLGRYAFEALRYLPEGNENPDFVLNAPSYRGAQILIAGPNFGCGSSREPAVWALMAMGLRCVIAQSFGDIFYSNCFQNGLLPLRFDETTIMELAEEARIGAGPFTVDLVQRRVVVPSGKNYAFVIDDQRRAALLDGLDDIGLTLKHVAEIDVWQADDRISRPWVWEKRLEQFRRV